VDKSKFPTDLDEQTSPPPKYEYFEHDQAYFRKRIDSGMFCVDDVYWPCVGWVPYSGDRQERYWFSGGRMDEGDVLRECSAQDEDLKLRAADAIAAALRGIVGASAPPAPVRARTITVITSGRVFHLTPDEFAAWKPGQMPAPIQPVKEEREHPNLVNLTEQTQGKAFQILAAPEKPKKMR
jgi:hypothetical protein